MLINTQELLSHSTHLCGGGWKTSGRQYETLGHRLRPSWSHPGSASFRPQQNELQPPRSCGLPWGERWRSKCRWRVAILNLWQTDSRRLSIREGPAPLNLPHDHKSGHERGLELASHGSDSSSVFCHHRSGGKQHPDVYVTWLAGWEVHPGNPSANKIYTTLKLLLASETSAAAGATGRKLMTRAGQSFGWVKHSFAKQGHGLSLCSCQQTSLGKLGGR